MSLNDPRWGRKGSEDESSKDEKEIKEPPTEPEQPRQTPQNPRPGFQNNSEGDLEELWKQFNDRLNSMLGGKGSNQEPPKRDAAAGSKNTSADDDYDFEEPPLREDHDFVAPNSSGGSGNGGSGGFKGARPPQFNVPSSFSGGMAVAAVVIALGAWLASGFYIVPEGQKGVVTTFGRYTESTGPGFRWHLPYPVQDASLVDVSSVRKAEIGLRGGTQRLKEALMLTDDENIVDVMFNVQYRIKEGNGAEEFLFRTRDPMGAVVQTAESAMREVVGRKKMDSVLFESKQEIAEEVKKLMQEMLDRYHSGIQVLSVAIQNAQPPEQVQAAFNDAVKAGQDRERQINEGEAYANDVVPKAKGLAERLRQEAEAYKSRVVSQAEGDSSRFEQVYQQYEKAPKVTRDRMYVDTMQQIFNNTSKIMVDNKSSNNLLFLPLDQLTKKASSSQSMPAAAVETSAARAPSSSSAEVTHNTPYEPKAAETDSEQQTSRLLSRTLR